MKESRQEKREICFCFDNLLREIQQQENQYIYIGAPPGSGKTTLLLKLEEVEEGNFIFMEMEPDDKDPYHLLKTFGEVISNKSDRFREYYEEVKNFSLKPLFKGLNNAFKKLDLSDYTYIFFKINQLEENTGEIISNYLIPLFEVMPKKRVILVGYEENPEYIPSHFKKYGYDYLKIGEKELERLCEFHKVTLNPNEMWRIIKATDGWILPIILILNKIKEGLNLEDFIRKKEIFKDLLSHVIETLEEKDKRLLYAISQFVKFDDRLVYDLFGIKNLNDILRRWERKGLYIEKREENNRIFYSLNPTFKEAIDDYIFSLKGGEIIYFLIHSKGAEYFSEKEDFASAAYHSVKALKYEDASKYLFYSIFDLMDKGRYPFVERLFEEIGKNKINEIPTLSLCYAIYLYKKRKYEECYKILKDISDKLLGREKLTWYYYYALVNMNVKTEKDSEDIVRTAIELIEKFPVEYLKKEHEKKWYNRLKASLYNLRGIVHRRYLRFKEAGEDYKRAIKLFDEIGNLEVSNILKNNLATLYLNTGEISKCENIIEELMKTKGPSLRSAYMNACLLNLVYKEDIETTERYLEKYLNMSQRYEFLDGWFYYFSLRFSIEGIYKKNVETAKKILDKFDNFLRENYVYSWENALFVHKIEFNLLNSNLGDINYYIRLLISRDIGEEDRIFLAYYSALYSHLIGTDRESILKKLDELEEKKKIINLLYLSKFSSIILNDFNDEQKEIVKERYLTYRNKYVLKK